VSQQSNNKIVAESMEASERRSCLSKSGRSSARSWHWVEYNLYFAHKWSKRR